MQEADHRAATEGLEPIFNQFRRCSWLAFIEAALHIISRLSDGGMCVCRIGRGSVIALPLVNTLHYCLTYHPSGSSSEDPHRWAAAAKECAS